MYIEKKKHLTLSTWLKCSTKNYIHETLLPWNKRYKPSPEDQILKAFQVLDTEGKGFLTAEELTKFMTEEGMDIIKTFCFKFSLPKDLCNIRNYLLVPVT